MSLRADRVTFSKLLSQMMLWINEQPGWEAFYDEVKVITPRAGRLVDTGKLVVVKDAVHGHKGTKKSWHWEGLAADIQLFINSVWITNSDHPAWLIIGRKWESKHPKCTSGIRWSDANHLSFGEGSKDSPI